MRKFQAKYITASGDAVDGRTRVYGVIVAGTSAVNDQTSTALPAIELKNGGSGGDVLLSVSDCANSADGGVYSGTVFLDLPAEGVLFPDGVYFTTYTNCKGACIFFEGGAAA